MLLTSSKVKQHCECIYNISSVNCLLMFIHVPIPLCVPFPLICCTHIWTEIIYEYIYSTSFYKHSVILITKPTEILQNKIHRSAFIINMNIKSLTKY